MKLGQLDRRITIQQKTVSRTALGDESESWSHLATVWAKVVPTSGREYFNAQAQQLVGNKTTVFRIRYLASARKDTELRVVYDGENYDIKHIAELGRNVGLDLVGEVNAEP